MIADAENQVKQVFADSESKIIKEKETLVGLQKETAEFKKRLLAMYRQHLELISLMPENGEEKTAEEEALSEEPVEAEETVVEETIEETEDIDFDEVSMAETKRIDLEVQD